MKYAKGAMKVFKVKKIKPYVKSIHSRVYEPWKGAWQKPKAGGQLQFGFMENKKGFFKGGFTISADAHDRVLKHVHKHRIKYELFGGGATSGLAGHYMATRAIRKNRRRRR